MEKMNALTLIITLVVGVILTGALLGPVISDATETNGTIHNDGYFRMQKITAEDTTEYTLEWTRSTDVFTLNGEVVDIGDHSQYSDELGVSVAMTDVSVSRYVTGLRVQSWISNVGGSMGYSSSTVSINFNAGALTITVDEGLTTESVKTATYEYAYFASNTGDYIMKAKDKTAAVLADSEVYAVGVTYLNSSSTPVLSVLKMTGNASEVEFSAIYGVSGQPTFSDIEILKTTNSKIVDAYDLNKITGTVTYDNVETAITYSYFVVPYEISGELTEHLTPGQISLMGAIPVMVIVALLMVAVGAIALRRAD